MVPFKIKQAHRSVSVLLLLELLYLFLDSMTSGLKIMLKHSGDRRVVFKLYAVFLIVQIRFYLVIRLRFIRRKVPFRNEGF